MKKKTIRISLAVAAMAMAGVGAMKTYGAYTAANMSDSELLLMENVEALSQDEMPHVKDCKYDKYHDCEALHPTDPSKDEYREHAMWK